MRVQHKQAYVLRTRAWSESSWIVDFLTAEFGRVTCLAKGARRLKSRTRAHLMPFRPLEIGWSGKGELPTVTGVEPADRAWKLSGENLLCGWYMSELVLRLLPRFDPHPDLFESFHEAIGALSHNESPEIVLRWFELNLLQETGYGLVLDSEMTTGGAIEAAGRYRYIVDRGPVFENTVAEDGRYSGSRMAQTAAVPVRGSTLLALQAGDLSDAGVRAEARDLLRAVIHRHLDGRPLKTRLALRQMRSVLTESAQTARQPVAADEGGSAPDGR